MTRRPCPMCRAPLADTSDPAHRACDLPALAAYNEGFGLDLHGDPTTERHTMTTITDEAPMPDAQAAALARTIAAWSEDDHHGEQAATAAARLAARAIARTGPGPGPGWTALLAALEADR